MAVFEVLANLALCMLILAIPVIFVLSNLDYPPKESSEEKGD